MCPTCMANDLGWPGAGGMHEEHDRAGRIERGGCPVAIRVLAPSPSPQLRQAGRPRAVRAPASARSRWYAHAPTISPRSLPAGRGRPAVAGRRWSIIRHVLAGASTWAARACPRIAAGSAIGSFVAGRQVTGRLPYAPLRSGGP